jgi:hypothetical protein
LKRGGVTLDYHPQPEAGHNTAWWPEMKDTFETFAREHPRNPLPDVLTWETARTDAGNRAHWLIIDKLGTVPGGAATLPDLNYMAMPASPDFGARAGGVRHRGHRRIERAAARPRGGRRGGPLERQADRRQGSRRRARRRHARLAYYAHGGAQEPAGRTERHLRAANEGRPAACAVHAHGAGRACRSDARRQHRDGHDARRLGVHAPAVAGSVRFREAGEGRRQRPDGVRREGPEGVAHAAEFAAVDNDRTMPSARNSTSTWIASGHGRFTAENAELARER